MGNNGTQAARCMTDAMSQDGRGFMRIHGGGSALGNAS